jgi:hypothetical protein
LFVGPYSGAAMAAVLKLKKSVNIEQYSRDDI